MYNQLLQVKYAFNLETLVYVRTQLLEVVCRGSETQLQVTENLN